MHYCGLRYWACLPFRLIRSASIAKPWLYWFLGILISLGLSVTLESCRMHFGIPSSASRALVAFLSLCNIPWKVIFLPHRIPTGTISNILIEMCVGSSTSLCPSFCTNWAFIYGIWANQEPCWMNGSILRVTKKNSEDEISLRWVKYNILQKVTLVLHPIPTVVRLIY